MRTEEKRAAREKKSEIKARGKAERRERESGALKKAGP
jgi:hypothetical protein